ncbi:MAG: S8 family serine peptidase, partial [Opitutaceae bacterium]
MNKLAILTIRTLALSLCISTAVWGGSAKLSTELQPETAAGLSATVEVIVQYKTPPTAAHHLRMAARGAALVRSYNAVWSSVYSAPRASLAAIAEDPDVVYVTPNRSLAAADQITDGTVHSDTANARGLTGTGIGIAIIDSGIVDLPDFHTGSTDRIVYQQSFLGAGTTPVDQFGHGTHVAGILAGNGNGTVYIGTVPNANIINLRVLDANGQGTDANVIAAIDTAISLKTKFNIKVINLSLGRPVFESASLDPLDQAVEAAWNAGIVVVVAAGNEGRNNTANTSGYGTIASPGNDPLVITVGCIKSHGTTTMTDDLIASYSSKGPTLYDHYVKPDVVAPGNLIVSTLPTGLTLSNAYPANRVTGNFFTLSGTSMATPVVSGAAAMAFYYEPNIAPDAVKAIIMQTATKNNFPASSVAVDPATGIGYTSYYDIFTIGAGELNITTANASTVVPTGSAASPSVAYNATTGQVTLQGIG